MSDYVIVTQATAPRAAEGIDMSAEKLTHFAPTKRRVSIRDPMCGYAKLGDDVTRDSAQCTCAECLHWLDVVHFSKRLNDSHIK